MRKYLKPLGSEDGLWYEAEKTLLKDKYLGHLILKFGPCKIKPSKKKDYFLDLIDTITSQQLSSKAAFAILNRIKEKACGKITPENILKLKDSDLRNCGMSWAKASYVKDLAEKVISKKLKVTNLDKLSDEEVEMELVAVKGIGPWSADMVLMFTLARPDVFPKEDLGIRKGIAKLLGKELKLQEMEEFSLRWKPWRTVASWYLWRVLEDK